MFTDADSKKFNFKTFSLNGLTPELVYLFSSVCVFCGFLYIFKNVLIQVWQINKSEIFLLATRGSWIRFPLVTQIFYEYFYIREMFN